MKKAFTLPLVSFFILLLLGLVFDLSFVGYIQRILIYVCINIILALSLNLVNGFTGQFSLGHAGFMAIGAYVSAFASTQFTLFTGSLFVLNFPIYALLGGLCAAIAGWLVGLPSLRLRGDYLAIVTLGFGEIIRVIILNLEAVGGARGFFGIPTPLDVELGPITISRFFLSFIIAAGWVVITFFTIQRLINSTHGRCFMSVREDEVAAEAMGINTTRVKVQSFVISSFFAGIAGSLFAHYAAYLNPATFQWDKSVEVVIMVVLGGMSSLSGSIIAAGIITILPEALRSVQDLTGLDLRMVIFALILIIMMIVRPQGLFGSTEITDFWRKRVRKST